MLVPTLLVVERLVHALGEVSPHSPDALLPVGWLTILLLFLAFASAFLFVLMCGAACQLVEYWLEGREVSLLKAYSLALTRFWRLAAAMLAVFGMICLGLAALFAVLALVYVGSLAALQVEASEPAEDGRALVLVVALFGAGVVASTALLLDALVRWAVFVQVVVIEGVGPVQALARSAQLMRGRWRATAWAMLALMVVPLLLTIALGAALTIILAPLVASGVFHGAFAQHAVLLAAQLALSPVAPIGATVLYYGLRDGDSAWRRITTKLDIGG